MKREELIKRHARRLEIFKIARRELERGNEYTLETYKNNTVFPYDYGIMEDLPIFVEGFRIGCVKIKNGLRWTFARDLNEYSSKGSVVNVKSIRSNINLAIIEINAAERYLNDIIEPDANDLHVLTLLRQMKKNLTNTLKEI